MEIGGIAPFGGWSAASAVNTPASAAPAEGGVSQQALDVAFGQGGEDARIAQEKAVANVMNDRFNHDCETCKARRYQDGSNDPGVSFKTAGYIDPAASAAVVASHEQEHVANEQAKAQQNGGKVLYQSVRLHGAVCPECGRYYIAGGVTQTVTQTPVEQPQQGGEESPSLDVTA